MIDRAVINVLRWDDLLDDLVQDLLAELFSRDTVRVLSADNDRIDALGHYGTAVVLILDRHLGLGVGPQPGQSTIARGLLHGTVQSVCQLDGKGKVFGGLIGGVAKHDALITGTQLLQRLVIVETLGNIDGLLLDGHQHVAGIVVEALFGAVVANVLDGTADDSLVVDFSLGGDLAENHNHACEPKLAEATKHARGLRTRLGSRLASHLGERILPEAGIEHGIGDLVAIGSWLALRC